MNPRTRKELQRRRRNSRPEQKCETLAKLRFNRETPVESVVLPTSKSIAARALILRYVNGDRTLLENLPNCDDTAELDAAMEQLRQNRHTFGCYDLGSGGTSLRFFLALAASLPGLEAEIDCSDALRVRPLKPLTDALRGAGADIEWLDMAGYAPMLVRGKQLDGQGITVNRETSSQYTSALMMVSDLWSRPFQDEDDKGVSRPYIRMTACMIEQFREHPAQYTIEPDWSAASYFYEYALLRPGVEIPIENLPPVHNSLQGDSKCAEIFTFLGVDTIPREYGSAILYGDPSKIESLRKTGVTLEIDMKDTPDLVPALVVGLCYAGIRYKLTGIAHLRHKESNRLTVLREEMAKAGFRVEDTEESLRWDGGLLPANEDETFFAHGDHRIAMALAAATVKRRHMGIRNADAVTKSYPEYFRQLRRLGIES